IPAHGVGPQPLAGELAGHLLNHHPIFRELKIHRDALPLGFSRYSSSSLHSVFRILRGACPSRSHSFFRPRFQRTLETPSINSGAAPFMPRTALKTNGGAGDRVPCKTKQPALTHGRNDERLVAHVAHRPALGNGL